MRKTTYWEASTELPQKVYLIYFAIALQLITSMNFYCINNCLKLYNLEIGFLFPTTQLEAPYWVIACFLGRISGAYILGKYAQVAGFFKAIHLVSGVFFVISLVFTGFCTASQYIHFNPLVE